MRLWEPRAPMRGMTAGARERFLQPRSEGELRAKAEVRQGRMEAFGPLQKTQPCSFAHSEQYSSRELIKTDPIS